MTQSTAGFWNRIARRYARAPVADEASYARKLAETRALMRPGMEVLEVGCGTGTTAIRHAPHVARIRATDISEKMLEIARDRAAAAGVTNIDFDCAALDDLALPPGSFDMVLALSLLHLVPDRDAALARLAAALKPGGYLVTSTACLSDSARWLRPLAGPGRALGLLPVLRFFTRAELEDSLRGAGLVLETSWRPRPKAAVFAIARKPG